MIFFMTNLFHTWNGIFVHILHNKVHGNWLRIKGLQPVAAKKSGFMWALPWPYLLSCILILDSRNSILNYSYFPNWRVCCLPSCGSSTQSLLREKNKDSPPLVETKFQCYRFVTKQFIVSFSTLGWWIYNANIQKMKVIKNVKLNIFP